MTVTDSARDARSGDPALASRVDSADVPQGRDAPPPPLDAVGLRYFAIDLPNQNAFNEVLARVDEAGLPSNQLDEGILLEDPSQNGILLRAHLN